MTARAAQDSGVSGLSGRLVEFFAAGSYTAYASVTTASDGSFVIAYPFGERTSPGLAGSGEGHGPDKMSGSELWRCGTESESLDQASSGGGGWGANDQEYPFGQRTWRLRRNAAQTLLGVGGAMWGFERVARGLV